MPLLFFKLRTFWRCVTLYATFNANYRKIIQWTVCTQGPGHKGSKNVTQSVSVQCTAIHAQASLTDNWLDCTLSVLFGCTILCAGCSCHCFSCVELIIWITILWTPRPFFFFELGALRSLGKVTKRHQGQLVVKNSLKVNNSLRAARSNLKRTGSGLSGAVEDYCHWCVFWVWLIHRSINLISRCKYIPLKKEKKNLLYCIHSSSSPYHYVSPCPSDFEFINHKIMNYLHRYVH